MAAPKIKVKVGGKVAVEPEDPGAEVREERPKRGKRKRNELKAAHEVLLARQTAAQPHGASIPVIRRFAVVKE